MAFARPLSAFLLLIIVAPHFVVATGFAGQFLACSTFLLLNGVAPGEVRARRIVLVAAGLSGAVLWVVADSQWVLVLLAMAIHAAVHRPRLRDAALLGIAGLVPALLLLGLLAVGPPESVHTLVRALAIALPTREDAVTVTVMLVAASYLADLCPRENDTPRQSRLGQWLGAAFAAAVLGVVTSRAEDTVRAVVFLRDCRIWSEAPALLNVLKWQAGTPIFGARSDVNSFVYSPLSELVSWAVLSPLGLALNLQANRIVVLLWQGTTVVLFAAAVAFSARREGQSPWGVRASVVVVGSVIAAVLWSSPVSPYLHPDHAVNACVAAGAFLLVAEPRLPRRVFLGALFLLPIVAVAFKLTSAGLGVGLVLALGAERRFHDVGILLVAGVLALATIPLFNAAFGPYSGYTLDLLGHHVLYPARWRQAIASPWGHVVVASAGAALLVSHRTPSAKSVRRLLLVLVGILPAVMAAFFKTGGMTNNLVTPTLVAFTALAVALQSSGEKRSFGLAELAGLSAVGVLAVLALPAPPSFGSATDLVERDRLVALRHVETALRAGRHPLVSSDPEIWLTAGGRGIPLDQYFSSLELAMARDPALSSYTSRISSGVYTSIVTRGAAVDVRPLWMENFGAVAVKQALKDRYCAIYPVDPSGALARDYVNRTLILQRRDLGCAPLAPAN